MRKEEIHDFLKSEPSIQELRRFAKMLGVRLRRSMKKRDITKAIIKTSESRRPSSENTTVNSTEKMRPSKPVNADLPSRYFRDYVVVHPVNPYWIHTMWDLSIRTAESLSRIDSKLFVRVSDITNIIYDGKNAHRFKEAQIDLEQGSWYFQVDFPDADYIGELGYYSGKVFVSILKSRITRTPRNSPKFTEYETWINRVKGGRQEIAATSEEAGIAFVPKSSGPSSSPSSEEFIKTISKSKSGR